MNFEIFIAKRYLTAKRKQAFISVISLVSILGITIGVMALTIALALMTGFHKDIQSKILSATSHIIISDLGGDGIREWVLIKKKIEEIDYNKEIVSITPVVHEMGLVSSDWRASPAGIRGLDFKLEEKSWLKKLEKGKLPKQGEVILGKELAKSVGVDLGDFVNIISTSFTLSPFGLIPKSKSFKVSGIFSTGLYEFDSTTAIIPIKEAQAFFKMKDRVSFIHITLKDIFKAGDFSERIIEKLSYSFIVTSWMELNRSLFSALKLEKKVIFFTISLIVFVASLNIIASLILMVMEKTRDIGILISMGATKGMIRRIFFFQGAIIGVFGTFTGLILGFLWCLFANKFQLIKVPIDIYQISYVPFKPEIKDLLLIVAISLAISFISTLFPSTRASRVNPAEALRYE
ncbi:MAG: FtsX-like permease family protein [Candidatus Aminicenantia bacterium]